MRFTPVIIAVIALAGLGVYDAVTAARMDELKSDGSVQAKLDAIPMAFDSWTGTAIAEAPNAPRANAIARIHRNYIRGGNHPASVTVLILAGASGELGAHDPERCLGGTGFSPVSDRTRKTALDGTLSHSLWARKFQTSTLPVSSIEIAWGWTAEGVWKAAEDARYEFASRRLLYKMYLSRNLPPSPTANDLEPDPLTEFLTSLAPLARTAIVGAQ